MSPPRRRGKDVAHSGQGADIRKLPAGGGDRAIDATLQTGVVGDIGLDTGGDVPKREDGRNGREGRDSAALQGNWMQRESFSFDGARAVVDARGDMNFESGLA